MPNPLDLHCAKCLPFRVFPQPRGRQSLEFPRVLVIASLLISVICTSCATVGSGQAQPAPVSVSVMPNSAQPYQGESVQFSASVQNAASTAVT